MNPKKIILCPNPSRDQGMTATKAAEKILHGMGFQTVVCSPFKDQKEGAFADYDVRPLPQELKGKKLNEELGHTLPQVLMGALLGTAIGLVGPMIW